MWSRRSTVVNVVPRDMVTSRLYVASNLSTDVNVFTVLLRLPDVAFMRLGDPRCGDKALVWKWFYAT